MRPLPRFRPKRPTKMPGGKAAPVRAWAWTVPALSLLLGLTACGQADNDPGPGGVTVGEARALDEAAEMLDSQRLPADALAASPTASPSAAASEAS